MTKDLYMQLDDKKYKRILLLVASSVLTAIPLLLPSLGFLQWISFVPLAVFFFNYASDERVSLIKMYGYGAIFFMSFYVIVFHWFVTLYPLGFIDGMTKPAAVGVVLIAWFGTSLVQTFLASFSFIIIAFIIRSRIMKRFRLLVPLTVAAVWAVHEWTQTIGWWGVPWARLAIGQSKYIVGLQTASLFGSYFVSFVIVAVNFYIGLALVTFLSKDKDILSKNTIKVASIVAVSLIVFQYGVGTLLFLFNSPSAKSEETIKIAVIQGNVSLGDQWDLESAIETEEVYLEYTVAAAEKGADIVLWPETALPYVVEEGNYSYNYISKVAKKAGVTVLAGALTEKNGNSYNSIVCFYPDGTMSDNIYSKQHIVPFGEFVPFKELIQTLMPPLADLVVSGSDLSVGEGSNIFHLDKVSIANAICYDSIFEDVMLTAVRDGAELICISTNDSWFEISAEMYMHNAQAQIRAVESGKYIARAANTGTSTVITNRGEIIAQIAPTQKDMIVEDVYVIEGRTLYGYVGNLFVYVCAFIIVLIFIVSLIEFICGKNKTIFSKLIDKFRRL